MKALGATRARWLARADAAAAAGRFRAAAAGSGRTVASRPGVRDPSGSLDVGLTPGVGVTLHLVLLSLSVIATQYLPSCSALVKGTPRLCARMCVRACVLACVG